MLPRFVFCLTLLALPALAADAIPSIPRVLPPEGLEIPADIRSRLETRLAVTKKRLEGLTDGKQKPDIEVFTKAVELALIHREFYVEKDFAKADWALDEANKRLDSLTSGSSPWATATGTVVQGYRSSIDNSAQPYGLVIPKDHDFTKPCPLYVWLHGRGDKATDLHFLQERATRPGQITPPGAIVVHPFGRHCVGWKHAGEIDVLEAVRSVEQRYKIDAARVVLIGFSMGGAGAWHIGAHYTENWVAVSPGAGFVDVAKYQKLTPANSGEWYVQKLWGLYDVPDYVRNLFNTNVIAYSGELDKQRAAAVLMEEAFQSEGRTLPHLIGPGVEHKYEPSTLAELMKRLAIIVEEGNEEFPPEAHVQTRTLSYSRQSWVHAWRLEEHWTDSRIDGTRSESKVDVQTKNIAQFDLRVPGDGTRFQFTIDGQTLPPGEYRQGLSSLPSSRFFGEKNRPTTTRATFVKHENKWQWLSSEALRQSLSERSKLPGLQGPIDDIFKRPFMIVAPSGKSKNPRFQAWVDFELAHFCDRWRALMRGEPLMKKDTDLTDDDERNYHLILWGDADSNSALARMIRETPISFKEGKWTFGDQTFDGDKYVPTLIYPHRITTNNLSPGALSTMHRYIVLNSGLTFREAHDGTNSQQNPKLPDWAIIDMAQPPDAKTPGRIHDADFFDENWQLKRQPKAP